MAYMYQEEAEGGWASVAKTHLKIKIDNNVMRIVYQMDLYFLSKKNGFVPFVKK
jgi:hypothetical protein